MHKYYGSIDWFENEPVFLFCNCLERGIEKEMEIPRLIEHITKIIKKEPIFTEKEGMRSAEEIMKDYGLEVIK